MGSIINTPHNLHVERIKIAIIVNPGGDERVNEFLDVLFVKIQSEFTYAIYCIGNIPADSVNYERSW